MMNFQLYICVLKTGMLRKLLPVAAFLIAFATVMTLLLVYMDTTAMRHHQFKINMTQDYDLLNVAQDDPQLITYIREVHIRPAVDPHHLHVYNMSHPSDKTLFVAEILRNKVTKDSVYPVSRLPFSIRVRSFA